MMSSKFLMTSSFLKRDQVTFITYSLKIKQTYQVSWVFDEMNRFYSNFFPRAKKAPSVFQKLKKNRFQGVSKLYGLLIPHLFMVLCRWDYKMARNTTVALHNYLCHTCFNNLKREIGLLVLNGIC